MLICFSNRKRLLAAIVGVTISLLGAQSSWALSEACKQINTDWSAGIRLPSQITDYASKNYNINQGELIEYFAKSEISPTNGGNYFAVDIYTHSAYLYGSNLEAKEVSGYYRAPGPNTAVHLEMMSNPDTSIYAKVTCSFGDPEIHSISPSPVRANTPTPVIINGKNLNIANMIAMDGLVLGHYITSRSDERIEVAMPPQPVGSVTISATSSLTGAVASMPLSFATQPDAPTISAIDITSSQASVAFTTPASNGSPILDYTLTANPGNLSTTANSSPLTIAGLSSGTSYTFTVSARNVMGTGQASEPSNPLVAKTPQSINFTQPGPLAFGATTTVTASASSGLEVTFSTTTPAICGVSPGGSVSALAVGDCLIEANQPGDDTFASAHTVTQTVPITPLAPDAPSLNSVSPGNGSVSVSFAPPSFTGGIPVGFYRVNVMPGGNSVDGASSPIAVPGLTNGVAYRFSVTAFNTAGSSAPSNESGDIIPKAPQSITLSNPGSVAFGDNASVTAAASSGLVVTVTSDSPTVCTVEAGGAITLLRPGTCTIRGQQAGNQSFEPAPDITGDIAVLAAVPGMPSDVSAIAGPGLASISFTAPAFTGGADIEIYTVTATPGGASASGNASPITLTGLDDGTDYSFVVTATNSVGTGAASLPSSTVTPRGSQTISVADPGNVSFGVDIQLLASASSGLALAFATDTPTICAVDASGLVTALAPGTCTITATQSGNSAFHAASPVSVSFAVQVAVPYAPSQVSAVPGNAEANVSFFAPVFMGGEPISHYTVISQPGGLTAIGSTSPILVQGLTNGTAYSFTVTASNSAGTSSASAPSGAVVPQAGQVISFTAPGPQIIGASLALAASASSGLPVSFLSQTGAICTTTSSGTATMLAAGSCEIEAYQSGDSAHLPAVSVSQAFSVSATQLTIAQTNGPLPPVMFGNSYGVQLSASGQSGALSWTLTGGALPAGLALDAVSGVISGVPLETALGQHSFVITAVDQSGGGIASASYSILVTPREISAPPKTVIVPGGTTPPPIDLMTDASGGPFLRARILSVEPANAGAAEIIAAPATLQFTPNPKYTGSVVVRYTLDSALGTSAVFTVTYALSADLAKVASDLTQMRDQFLAARSNLWVSGIYVPTLQDRRSAVTSDKPGTVSISPSSGVSLTLSYAASTQSPALGAAEGLATAPADDGGLRFWIDGSNSIHVRTGNSGERWGGAAALSMGADVLAGEEMLIGVSLHADWMDERNAAGRIEGSGLSFGPYLSVELAENLYFDASLIYGESWNSINDGFFAGAFGTTRVLARTKLSGKVALTEDLTLLPNVSLFYLREEAGAFVASDAAGTTVMVGSILAEQLRANAGASLQYRLVTDAGLSVQPFIGLELGSVLSAGRPSSSATLSGGIDLAGDGSWTLGLAGKFHMSSDGMRAASAQVKFGVGF